MSRLSIRITKALAAFLLFSINITFAQSEKNTESKTKKYQSLLWEISGNGMAKPSYLYGTMHVSQKVAFHLTDTFFIALKECNAIALEEDPGTWLDEMANSGYLSTVNSFSGAYGNFYKSAFQLEIPKNKDLAQSLSMQPAIVNGLLYRFYSKEGNFEENTYLDLFIYQSAKKIGKPVIGLESFAVGQEYSYKASLPDSDKVKDYDAYDYYGSRGNITEQIEDAYRKGDLDVLDSLSRVANRSKNIQKYLIDERNKIFVTQMDSIMRSSTSLFTGVGAAHLPGDNGVISMLRAKGYNVRPVVFKQSKQADKDKQKIETTFRPNTYTQQYFPDSTVSFMSPGKMTFLVGGANSFYIYPDMTNGAYYSILAMNRFESLTGQDMQYTIRRVDSLLYESVPGKILERKLSQTPEGFPSVDVTNRNRRGDVSRYRIIVTPEYIYFFNVSGTGDYLLDKQHDKFFNSIQFATNKKNNEWSNVKGDGGGFSLSMPGVVYNDVKAGGGMVNRIDEFVHSFHATDSSFYLYMKNSYPDYTYIEEDTFELSQLVNEFAETNEMKVLSKEITNADCGLVGKHPSILATLEKDSAKSFVRVVINGQNYHFLFCKPGTADQHEKYFNSFRLEPMKYAKSFEEVVDTSLDFKVNSYPDKGNTLAKFMGSRDFGGDFDNNYNSEKIKRRTFKSPITNENILVTCTKYNPFYSSKNSDTFWKYRINDLNDDTSLVVTHKEFSVKDSIETMSLTLTDTASTRGIKVKMILKKDALYKLSTVVDTMAGVSEWVKNFYDSFMPNDTASNESLFVPKVAKFFEYLASSDSLKAKQARKNFWNVRFDSTAVPQMIAWLNDTASLKAPSSFRESMIRRVGLLKSDKSIPFLKDLYAKSSDSSNIQMAILGSLSARQTVDGTLAFKELILQEAPLSSESYQISNMFSRFYDSLEIATKLYPGILQLCSYPEYKSEIYSLLAAIVTNKKLAVDDYKSFLPTILHDANDELKRTLNSDNDESNNDDDDSDGGSDNDYGVSDYANNSRSGRYGQYGSGTQSRSSSSKKDANEYSHNSDAEDFAIIMTKYYPTEIGVKNFFNKLQKSKNKSLVMNSYLLMLRNNIQTSDSVWKNYSASLELRAELYGELKKLDHLEKFDTTYNKQKDLVEAVLFDHLNMTKDSIEFVEKKLLKAKSDSGYVYIYKMKKEKASKWSLAYCYFQPEDEKKADVFADTGFETIKDPAKMQKQIDKVYKRAMLTGRPRAGNGRSYDYLNFD